MSEGETDIGARVRELEERGRVAAERVKALAKPAWVPTTEPTHDPLVPSRFGGVPWLGSDEVSACPACGSAEALLVQLDLSALPWPRREEGLFQCFMCIGSDCHESRNLTARVIDGARAMPKETGARLESAAIVGWDEVSDLPDEWLWEELGLEFDEGDGSLALDFLEFLRAPVILGGWGSLEPQPRCPECENAMEPFLRFSSAYRSDDDETVPIIVHRCASHPGCAAAMLEPY